MSLRSLSPLLRAAPRLLWPALLLLVAWTANQAWVAYVAAILGIAGVLSLLSPGWWHYVRTGESLRNPVAPEYTEPGTCRVELLDVGPKYIYVVKALRQVRDLTLPEAKQLAESVPVTVVEGLSSNSARAVAEQIEDAGGTSRIVDIGPGA